MKSFLLRQFKIIHHRGRRSSWSVLHFNVARTLISRHWSLQWVALQSNNGQHFQRAALFDDASSVHKKHVLPLPAVVIDASSGLHCRRYHSIADCWVLSGERRRKKRAKSKTSYRLSLSLFLLKPGAYEGVKLKLCCTVAAWGECCVQSQCTSYRLIALIL